MLMKRRVIVILFAVTNDYEPSTAAEKPIIFGDRSVRINSDRIGIEMCDEKHRKVKGPKRQRWSTQKKNIVCDTSRDWLTRLAVD